MIFPSLLWDSVHIICHLFPNDRLSLPLLWLFYPIIIYIQIRFWVKYLRLQIGYVNLLVNHFRKRLHNQ